jgi:hypothetical protein
MLDDSQQSSEDHKLVDRNTLEEHILLLLSDLIVIAIDKFERVRDLGYSSSQASWGTQKYTRCLKLVHRKWSQTFLLLLFGLKMTTNDLQLER